MHMISIRTVPKLFKPKESNVNPALTNTIDKASVTASKVEFPVAENFPSFTVTTGDSNSGLKS